MPLPNFGAILTFAEELERQAAAFYRAWGQGPSRDLADGLARESDKNIKNVERIRRENVSEMILEPIVGFTRAPYATPPAEQAALDDAGRLTAARDMEEKAAAFYRDAAEKLSALPEVARLLARLGTQRAARLERLK